MTPNPMGARTPYPRGDREYGASLAASDVGSGWSHSANACGGNGPSHNGGDKAGALSWDHGSQGDTDLAEKLMVVENED